MTGWWKASGAVVSAVLLLLAAFVGFGLDASAKAITPGARIHRGGSLSVMCTAPITSMDTATSKEADCDSYAYHLLYDSLVQLDDHGNVKPDLATSWSISPSGTKYTFHLRSGVKFSDGTPLDAQAVVTTLTRDKNTPICPIAIYLKPVTSIMAPDSNTVVITLSAPSEPLLMELGGADAGIESATAINNNASALQLHPVGSGPFTLQSWTPGSTATFQRSPHYWQKGSDGKALPYLNSVVLNSQGTSSVALLDVKSGQTDYDVEIDPSDLASTEADKALTVQSTNLVVPYMIAMNSASGIFTNHTLRLAVEHAINRKAIIASIGFGAGYTSPMPFSKAAWYYVSSPSPKYDPKLAKQELKGAGYPNGLTVHLSVIDRSPDAQIAQIVQSQLAAVGIKANIDTLERTTWVNTWYAHQGQIGTLRGGGGPSSPPVAEIQDYNPASINDYPGWQNDQMVNLINEATQTTDKTKEKAILKQIDQLIISEAPYVNFGNIPLVGVARKNVHGVDGTLENVTRAWKS